MAKYTIIQDRKKCIGCMACVVHCKIKNNLPEGVRFCNIIFDGPKEDADGIPRINFIFRTCLHCTKAYCLEVCPTGAVKRRVVDGIVYIDEKLCIGCMNCQEACPWGIPQINPLTKKAVKCNLCMDRLDKGELPACVEGCTTSCLKLQVKR